MTLIDRLSKLDGPDRECDWLIAKYFEPARFSVAYDPLPPAYTASVDADIALAERVLPEHHLIIHTTGFAEAKHHEKRSLDASGNGATPAIAAVIAILRAEEAGRV